MTISFLKKKIDPPRGGNQRKIKKNRAKGKRGKEKRVKEISRHRRQAENQHCRCGRRAYHRGRESQSGNY